MGGIAGAVRLLKQGGVIAHATEGVWGLACDAHDRRAVRRVVDIKQRNEGKGLIVIGAGSQAFAQELAALDAELRDEIQASWPGPHTWILPNCRFGALVTGGRATVACRVPGHDQARSLAARFGGPLVSTSANISGGVALTTEDEVRRHFATEVDTILSGQVLTPGVPSTIHQIDGAILR